jgi:opacity protein-like surface antigen
VRALTAIAIIAAGMALWPSPGTAQDREPGFEFGVDVLYQFSKDIGFEGGSSVSLEDDLGVALTFGYRFDQKFELQFALDWSDVDYNGTLQSGLAPGLAIDVDGSMETFVPRFSGVYNFIDGPLTPFVTAGLGWAFIDTNIPTERVQVGCWWDPWWGYICTPYQDTKSTDGFLYQAGAGVRWDVGGATSFRLSYDKTWVDLNNATSTPGLDQLTLGFSYRY